MKKILFMALALSALLVMMSCKVNPTQGANLGRGKVMSLEFITNPSTGYSWEYKFENGDGEVEYDREESILNENLDLLGAPNKVIYYFRGVKEGNRNLVFTYRRPWVGGDIAYDVVYELSVDKNLNITCLSKMKGVVESNEDLSFFPNPVFLNN